MGFTGNYPHQTQSIWKVLKRRTLETWINDRLTRVHHKNTIQNFPSSRGEKWNEKKNQLKINQGRNVVIVGKAGPNSRKKIPCPRGIARFPMLLTEQMKSWLLWPTMWLSELLWDTSSQTHMSWTHSLENTTTLALTGKHRNSQSSSGRWFLPTGTTSDTWLWWERREDQTLYSTLWGRVILIFVFCIVDVILTSCYPSRSRHMVRALYSLSSANARGRNRRLTAMDTNSPECLTKVWTQTSREGGKRARGDNERDTDVTSLRNVTDDRARGASLNCGVMIVMIAVDPVHSPLKSAGWRGEGRHEGGSS